MEVHWIKLRPDTTSIGLAEIEPGDIELIDHFGPEVEHLHPKKKLEYVASRKLIGRMCEQIKIPYKGIRKDEYGKPFLIDSAYHISISHSYPMVVCAIHLERPCGIDIESSRPQLLKIKHKFLNEAELAFCGDDLSRLCLHWSAKEALYKIYGRKRLLFAEQLAVKDITENEIKAQVMAEGHIQSFTLNYELFLEYFVVFNV